MAAVPPQEDLKKQSVAQRGGVLSQATKHWFVNDIDHPYIEKQAFRLGARLSRRRPFHHVG